MWITVIGTVFLLLLLTTYHSNFIGVIYILKPNSGYISTYFSIFTYAPVIGLLLSKLPQDAVQVFKDLIDST